MRSVFDGHANGNHGREGVWLPVRAPPTPMAACEVPRGMGSGPQSECPSAGSGWEDVRDCRLKNDSPKRAKAKPLWADPNSGYFIIFILQKTPLRLLFNKV